MYRVPLNSSWLSLSFNIFVVGRKCDANWANDETEHHSQLRPHFRQSRRLRRASTRDGGSMGAADKRGGIVRFPVATRAIPIVWEKGETGRRWTATLVYHCRLAFALARCFALGCRIEALFRVDWLGNSQVWLFRLNVRQTTCLWSHVRFLEVVWEFVQWLCQTQITLASSTSTWVRIGSVLTRELVQMGVVCEFALSMGLETLFLQ